MPQPVKKNTVVTKPPKKKRVKPKDERLPKPPKKSPIPRGKRPHKEYGTSKLEVYFAKEFLDKLGLKYTYQYKAESIGRYFDFAVYTKQGSMVLIEVDGDYFHGYNKLYEDKNPMQKHSEWVDKHKNAWALERGIPIIRIWEHDIRDNGSKVMKMLKERLTTYDEIYQKKQEKNKRH